MTKKPKICALGSVNLDLIIKTKTLPRAGETVSHGTYSSLPGGKGANTALAAQRLGADVSLIAAIGDDDYASQALKFLEEDKVDLTNLLRRPDAHTGLAFINVSDDGENQIAVAPGANLALTEDRLPHIDADAIITQFEIPLKTIIAASLKFDGFLSVNASPVLPEIGDLIERADLIIVNEGEYHAYEELLKSYTGLLAITLGGNGARLISNGDEIARALPPRVEVLDTTGAGDSFAAALTVALLEKQPPQQALEFACTVGALTTTSLGTQAATPYRSDVENFIQSTL